MMEGAGTTRVKNSVIEEHRFQSRSELVDAAARLCEQQLQTPRPTMMVSGGSTPLPVYQRLARSSLNWQDISVGLVDERWVPNSHAASNEGSIRKHLQIGAAASADFVPMKNECDTANQGAKEANAAYSKLSRPFTLTVLGMGPDGHTASWFPDATGLSDAFEGEAICYPIKANQSEVTGEFTERMTLGLKAVLNSNLIVLLITGDKKWQVYQQAKQASDFYRLPISALLANESKTEIQVFWSP
jgi:6-phosphogluconolactonase